MVKSNCQGDVEFYPPENYESLALISGGPKSLKTSGLLCRLDRAGMDPQSLLKQSLDLMWNCFFMFFLLGASLVYHNTLSAGASRTS
jgi:hypothetical protein